MHHVAIGLLFFPRFQQVRTIFSDMLMTITMCTKHEWFGTKPRYMTNLSTIETSGGYTSLSTISSATTMAISSPGTALVSSSFSTVMITTLFLFLYPKCIVGLILDQLERVIVIYIMPHIFIEITEQIMVCRLVLLLSWEAGWHMSPLSTYIAPFCLSRWKWTQHALRHIIFKYRELIYEIPF
jgi:hypothetical protein